MPGKPAILTGMRFYGFRSFLQEHVLELSPGPYFILGKNHDGQDRSDSNGAGKSSLASVIPWALYGKISTGADKDSVIHDEAEEAMVRLTFNSLTVERRKRRGHPERLRFYQNSTGWVEEDLRPTQEALEKALGLSSRLFFNSVWIDRESRSVQFLFAQPSKRLEILEEILDSEVFSEARKRSSEKLTRIDRDLSQAEARLASLRQQEKDMRARLERAREGYARAVEAVSQRMAVHQARMASIRVEIHKTMQAIDSLPRGEDASILKAELDRVSEKLTRIRQEIAFLLPASTFRPENIQKRCPTCLRPWTDTDVRQAKLEALAAMEKLQELRKEEQELQVLERDLNYRLARLQTSSREKRLLEERLRDLKKQLQEAGDNSPSTEEDPALAAFQQAISEASDALKGIQKTIEEETVRVLELQHQKVLTSFWYEAFGSRGIRSMILDDVRGIMTHYANSYSRMLSAGDMQISFPQGDRGFEVLLRTGSTTREIESLSRGEVWRANLSVLLALRKALQVLSKSQLSLLIVDDPVGDLDESGGAAIASMCLQLTDEFHHVLVTLPRPLQVPEDRILLVEKRGGRSVLEVV